MSRKCEHSVATVDKRTFTNLLGAEKDWMIRDQNDTSLTPSGLFHDFKNHQSEDTRNRHSYVNFIIIITFTLPFFPQAEFIV